MQTDVVADRAALADAVASRIAMALAEAVAARRAATVAFSGGNTPAPMLRRLAELNVAWPSVTVFQVDERVAPDDHPDRNAGMLRRELVDRVGATTHLMPVTADDLEAAAEGYAKLLDDVCGGVLDVVHLGLGADGHTASLVPDDAVLSIDDRDVALTGLYEGRRRMTLTYPALARARRIVWEVAGPDRAAAVRALRDGGDIPGAHVARNRAVVVVTADAVA